MLKSFFNWKVGVNLLITLGIFAGLVWGVFEWLKFHTHHNKEVPVPNVVDMPVQQAVKVLEDMGLGVEVDSFKYDPKYKPFQVLQIYPTAGARVKEGRSIILKVNPKTWAKVEVPDVLDKYKGLAFSRLNLVGLKIGDTLYEANIQKDAVIRMEMEGREIKPGMFLPKFSVVDLVIGTGPMRNIPVPNLVGLSVKEAKMMIKKHHFELGIIDYADGDNNENAIVYYQDPASGSLRDQGMQIDLWASKKTPAEMYQKVKELDRIYRKYDVPLAEEEMSFEEDWADEPKPKPVEKPKVEKPQNPASQEKKKTEEKPKPTATRPKETTPEKPKEKKVVIE